MTDRTETNGNPEVPEKAKRRRFDAGYKLRILDEAEQCSPYQSTLSRVRAIRWRPRALYHPEREYNIRGAEFRLTSPNRSDV